MVTRRLRPLMIEGHVIHQIGLPFHWAFAGECVGGNANDLTSLVADPNVSMHECKAFACQVHAGRHGGPTPRPTVAPAPSPTDEPDPGNASQQPSLRGDSDMASREKELGTLPQTGEPPRESVVGTRRTPGLPVSPRSCPEPPPCHRFLHRYDSLYRL